MLLPVNPASEFWLAPGMARNGRGVKRDADRHEQFQPFSGVGRQLGGDGSLADIGPSPPGCRPVSSSQQSPGSTTGGSPGQVSIDLTKEDEDDMSSGQTPQEHLWEEMLPMASPSQWQQAGSPLTLQDLVTKEVAETVFGAGDIGRHEIPAQCVEQLPANMAALLRTCSLGVLGHALSVLSARTPDSLTEAAVLALGFGLVTPEQERYFKFISTDGVARPP